MLVSIIIPCYNSDKTLRASLDSVFALKAADVQFEVILVDDGSTDNTLAIAKAYPRATVIVSDRNGGAAHARNLGVKHSKGELLFFLDSDVAVEPNALDLAFQAKQRNWASCVVGLFSPVNPFSDFPSQYKALYCNWKYQDITGTSALNTAVTLIDKSAFEAVGGFDVSMMAAEDNELGEKLSRAGYKIHVERSLEVLHIKQFSFVSLLKNDYRKSYSLALMFFRQLHLRKLSGGSEFSDISQSLMLNVPLSYLVLIAMVCIPLAPTLIACVALISAAAFAINNRSFMRYLARRKSLPFAMTSLAFTLLDFWVVGLAVAAGAATYANSARNKVTALV